eukprot:TRINITY_DN7870_c0_g1_i1.p1 TRINITY_DN7870_c0_g1~~TRINITY_DN7870_c0_g1_i1.p1  ORF type:complete len:359 (+),score=21.26 TRINITY_DN7870_c0_g1_i1:87-1163(+)
MDLIWIASHTMRVLLWMSLAVAAASSKAEENLALGDAAALLQTPASHAHLPRASTGEEAVADKGLAGSAPDAMGSRPKAIVHVGPHKTGSTSLQNTLFRHRRTLASDGFAVYPDSYSGGPKSRFPLLLREVGYCTVFRPVLSALSCDYALSHFRSFLEGAQRANRDVVLSSEYFGMSDLNVSVLADALRGFDTTIVVIHRPYFEWISSVHSQRTTAVGDRLRPASVSDTLESFAMRRVLRSASGLDSSSIAVYSRFSRDFGRVSMRALAPNYIRRFVCDDVQAKSLCRQLQWTQEMHNNTENATSAEGTACMNASEKELLWTVSVSLEAQALALIGEGQMLNVTDLRARFDHSSFKFC